MYVCVNVRLMPIRSLPNNPFGENIAIASNLFALAIHLLAYVSYVHTDNLKLYNLNSTHTRQTSLPLTLTHIHNTSIKSCGNCCCLNANNQNHHLFPFIEHLIRRGQFCSHFDSFDLFGVVYY